MGYFDDELNDTVPIVQLNPGFELVLADYKRVMPDSNQYGILLVDDRPSVRSLLEELLSLLLRKHFPETVMPTLYNANDGSEALEFLKFNGGMGLVLTDLEMPRMNGDALAIASQQEGINVPYVLLTGSQEYLGAKLDTLPGLIYARVQKPYKLNDLSDVLFTELVPKIFGLPKIDV